jgi:GH35 family endo-1,4-beta-xylanase
MKRMITLFLMAALAASGFIVYGQDAPLAAGQSKFLGCAWSSPQNANFAKYWNQVTPENGGKWGSVEYTRDVMNWNDFDASYKLAKDNGYPFKAHTLIWGAQQPSWMATLDSAAQRQEIEEWFSAMAARYDSFAYIDVVNEPLHNAPNGMLPWGSTTPNINYAKALGGAGATGWDWVITSFRLARQYFPKSKLILNEYSVINSTTTTQQYISLINLLKAENLIDGIGEQAHAFTTYGVATSTLKANLDLLAETGIPIYLTELDIDGATDLAQLKEYQRIFPMFWEHPGIEGITLWGFRYGLWRTDQGAYLVNQNNTERTAFKWLKAYVNDTLTLAQSIEILCDDPNDTLYIDETSQMTALVLPANTTIPNVTWSVLQTNLATINQSGLLDPVATGKVTVKVTAWDGSGKMDTKYIWIINRPVDSIALKALGDIDTIGVNETLQLQAEVFPANATNKNITWNINPNEIADITTNGLLTGVASGKVKITASAADGSGVADTLSVSIILRYVDSVIVASAGNLDTITVEDEIQMQATILPANASNLNVTWSVSPGELAVINSDGLLTALTAGKVTVTATATDGSGISNSMDITIKSIPVGITDRFLTENLLIYPNPASGGKFTIQGLDQIATIEILDLFGNKVKEFKALKQNSLLIQLDTQPGIYVIKLSDGQQIGYKKIVVE